MNKKYYNRKELQLLSHRKETYSLKKFFKWFISLAAIGSAIGLIIAYFCKGRCNDSCCEDTQDSTEEDFDLDSDLQPVADREYVPLKRTADAASDTKAEEPAGKEEAPGAPAGEKE